MSKKLKIGGAGNRTTKAICAMVETAQTTRNILYESAMESNKNDKLIAWMQPIANKSFDDVYNEIIDPLIKIFSCQLNILGRAFQAMCERTQNNIEKLIRSNKITAITFAKCSVDLSALENVNSSDLANIKLSALGQMTEDLCAIILNFTKTLKDYDHAILRDKISRSKNTNDYLRINSRDHSLIFISEEQEKILSSVIGPDEFFRDKSINKDNLFATPKIKKQKKFPPINNPRTVASYYHKYENEIYEKAKMAEKYICYLLERLQIISDILNAAQN